MKRAPYRRVTPSRQSGADYNHEYSPQAEESNTISHSETLIIQCIICGIIMVFVLIASMTDIAPATRLRYGIRQVLTGAETLDELIADVRQFGADWLDLEFQPSETVITPEDFYIPEETPAVDPNLSLEQTAFPSVDYENTYINDLPPAADQQVSNLTVPEPPVTPGLWD